MWASNLSECTDPADFAYCTCNIYSCGYSQPNRTHISVKLLEKGTAETDCSAGVSWWLFMGGFIRECPWFSTSWERDYLVGHGFELFTFGAKPLQRNDVLWRSGHTGLYIGSNLQAEALRDENYDAGWEGTTPGDQDDGETVVRYLTSDWEYVLRKENQPIIRSDDMQFLFTCNGKYKGNVYFYDGGNVHRVGNQAEQKAIIDAGTAVGVTIPLIHLDNGDALIECCKRSV